MLEPIESELAKRRQLAALKQGDKLPERMPSGSNEPNGEGRVKEIIAKKVGLSPTTYQRAKTIIEKAPEELKEKVRTGETSINYAYKQVKRAEGQRNYALTYMLVSLAASVNFLIFGKKYKCETCGAKFKTSSELGVHKTNQHK